MERTEEIFLNDRLIQLFGMRLVEARDGYAKVSAVVEEKCLNAHGIAHGGFLFSVADAAFALAVNAVRDAVGVSWSFNIMKSAKPGETVVAECRTIHAGGRSAVCELTVTADSDGRVILRGMSTALPLPRKT